MKGKKGNNCNNNNKADKTRIYVSPKTYQNTQVKAEKVGPR